MTDRRSSVLDLEKSTPRLLLRLAIPVFVEQLLILMVGLVDTWLTGHFVAGEAPMAAIGLMAYLLWMLSSLFGGVSVAASALIARHMGAGELSAARHTMHQAFLLGALMALATTLLMTGAANSIAGWLQLGTTAQGLATQYLWIVIPVLPALMVQLVGIACLRGAGDTTAGFYIMALVNLVNATVSTTLVLGLGPFPRCGWSGLAFGTAVGYVVGALGVIVCMARGRAGLQFAFRELHPNRRILKRLLHVGVPGGVDGLTIVACHLWFLTIINSLGTLPAAAHSLAIRIESLAYIPGTAFEVAVATLSGQFLGYQNPARAMRAVVSCSALITMFMLLISFAFRFYPHELTLFFTGSSNQLTAAAAAPLLSYVALVLPLLGLTMVLSGALRGAGDTRFPLGITLIGFLLVRIPLARYLAHDQICIPLLEVVVTGRGWGVLGAWYAMGADLALRATLTALRVASRRWLHMRF